MTLANILAGTAFGYICFWIGKQFGRAGEEMRQYEEQKRDALAGGCTNSKCPNAAKMVGLMRQLAKLHTERYERSREDLERQERGA